MRLLKRFFAWIGSLMRRRKFIATTSVITPPPPPSGGLAVPQILLALQEL